jgi:hypothetical protein
MKNIHILPTDKPSRLYLHSNNELQLRTNIIRTSEDYLGTNQNIYITSDEEIKVGDWVIEFQKCDDIGEVHFTNNEYVIAGHIQKKIILTTDELYIHNDLIPKEYNPFPQYIQKIDYEFLEWFVKNPTCEEVEVIKVCSTGRKCDGKGKNCNMAKLKIIIPKEEQKQDYSGVHLRHCYQGEYEDGCKYGEDDCPAKPLEKPKKLTDLEIAIKLEEIEREEFQQETLEKGLMEIELNHTKILVYSCERALEERNEQIKRMYSEEDVYHILCEHTAFLFAGGKSTLSEWFEKYKKK